MGYSPIDITQALNIYYTFNCPAFISSVKDPERLCRWFKAMEEMIIAETGKHPLMLIREFKQAHG